MHLAMASDCLLLQAVQRIGPAPLGLGPPPGPLPLVDEVDDADDDEDEDDADDEVA